MEEGAAIPIEPDFEIGNIISKLTEDFGPPLQQELLDPEDCYTTEELMEIWGFKDNNTIRKRLRKIKKEGLLIETTKKVEVLGRPGVYYDVPAYQTIEEKTKDG